jgi:hypothetical protein
MSNSIAESGWLDQAREQLAAIRRLPRGWDSYGADPPISEIVDAAMTLLESLHSTGLVPKPHIYPTRSGGVQFEWENGARYFEIEIVSSTVAELFYSDAVSHVQNPGRFSLGDPLEPLLASIRSVLD